MTDYETDPIAVADVITKVEAHIDPLETATDTMSTEIDDAAVACKRPEVSSALFSLWNELPPSSSVAEGGPLVTVADGAAAGGQREGESRDRHGQCQPVWSTAVVGR